MIQQLVGTIVSGLTIEGDSIAPTYLHGWKGWNNLIADELQGTVVILIDPVVSNSTLVGSLSKDKYPLLILFLEKSDLEWTPDQHLVVIDRMRRLCTKFMYAAKQSDLFSEVIDFIISDEYCIMNVGMSGVGLQVKITPTLGPPVC
jgi:hypothetical protein